MAIKKVKIDESAFTVSNRGINEQVKEVLDLEKDLILSMYKKGSSNTKIAEVLNENYKDQFIEVLTPVPAKEKGGKMTEVMMKPTVTMAHIRNLTETAEERQVRLARAKASRDAKKAKN